MATVSENGIITLNRGDTFSAPILINIGTKMAPVFYDMDNNDTIYISICEPEQMFEYGIIRRIVTSDMFDYDHHAWFTLTSEDTSKLHSGTYYYEIKIKLSNDVVVTIVPRKKFIILD